MSNRDALRKLTKKFPPPQEVKSIMDALRDESDLSAAIIASALLESALEKFLIGRMREKEPRLLGQLFENRGPLSDFNGKILCAVAFGVLSVPAGEHFQAIRHIRNAFAHSRVPISFETPQVRKEIDGFGAIRAMKEVHAKIGEIGGKSAFLLIVTILLIQLDSQHQQAGLGKLYDDGHEPKAPR